MRRGQKTNAEQVVLKLRQIEVQTAPGKSLALACREAQIVIGLWQSTDKRVRPHSSLGYRPPAPVSHPDLAVRLPMGASMLWPLNRLGPKYRSGQSRSLFGTHCSQKKLNA